MANMLVYVDKILVVPMATKLLGSSITISQKKSKDIGFDWFLQSKVNFETNREVQASIVDFFAEDIFNMAYERVQEKKLSIKTFCKNVDEHRYSLSDIVSITGVLEIPDIEIGPYNPFDPPQIELAKTYTVNDTECFIAQLTDHGYRLPIYFPTNSKNIICYCIEKPVEIIGVLQWSPNYEVAPYSLNQTILGVALMFQD